MEAARRGGGRRNLRVARSSQPHMAARHLPAAVLVVSALGLGLAGSPAAADCCMGGPDLPVAFHSTFPEPVVLGSSVRGTVRSDGPARYVAQARVNVGPRTVVRLRAVDGRSDTTPSRLVLRLSAAQRRTIAAAAHRRHVARVLYVQVKGTLDGQSGDRYGFDHFTISLKRSGRAS